MNTLKLNILVILNNQQFIFQSKKVNYILKSYLYILNNNINSI